jgi:predicted transcriptional regulator
VSDNEVVRVSDVMTDEFLFVKGKDTVAEALLKMKEVKPRILIVDKRSDDDEYGIVCLGDLARKVLAQRRAPDRVNIYEIMTKPVLCVSDKMDIRFCARMFDQFGIHNSPVIDSSGGVVGVIGFGDMVLKGLMSDI